MENIEILCLILILILTRQTQMVKLNKRSEQKQTNERRKVGTVKIEWKTVSNFLSSFWQVEIFSSS